jgi:hypothetical protein
MWGEAQAAFSQDVRLMEEMFQILLFAANSSKQQSRLQGFS